MKIKKIYFIISLISIIVLSIYLVGSSIDVYVKKSALGLSGIALVASALFIITLFILSFVFKLKLFYKIVMSIGVFDVIVSYLCGFVFFQQIGKAMNAMIFVSIISYVGAIMLILNFVFIVIELIRTRKNND